MIGKKGEFSKELKKDYDVFMRCERREQLRCLEDSEAICSLKGRFWNVKESIYRVINRMRKYAESNERDFG